MIRTCVSVIAAAVALQSVASVRIGENLLVNGMLEADQVDFPQGWSLYPTRMIRPEWNPNGGPGGIPCITFTNDDNAPSGERSVRQGGFKIALDGRYRISAWVRPRAGFTAKGFGLRVINSGWLASRGVGKLPETGKWTKVSEEFSGFPTKGGYLAVVCLSDFKGSLDVADLRLEAVDEAGAAGAMRSKLSSFQSAPRIVAWRPLLGEIPKTTREVSFRLLGSLPDGWKPEDCDMVLRADGAAGELAQPASDVLNTFRLPPGADSGVISARIVHRATGSNVVERAFRYRTVDVPSPESLKKHRRLNNYVTEMLRGRAAADGTCKATFGVSGRKWIFVKAASRSSFTLALDGETVMTAATPRHEVFREVMPGDHTIALSGCAAGDGFVVRAIPEILNYCPSLSVVKENPPFDWKFQKRYALPAVTTMNGGMMPPTQEEMAEYRALGGKWVANLHTIHPTNAADIASRLAGSAGMNSPRFDGVTCDEQFCGRDAINSSFIGGLRAYDLEARPSRGIYTWLVGKPMSGIFDAEFISECANVSLGRGMVLTETYCRSRATEKEAQSYIEAYICEAVRRFKSSWPEVMPSFGMVLGNFTQVPVLSLHHHCGMDYRYFLDMQFHALANDPSLDGLGLAGYWGSYYIDEETLRWCFMLLRHYCIDGNTEMLSGKYGFAYNPGFVKNPDFAGGLDGWRADGDISPGKVKDFGRKGLGLFESAGAGDAFAVLARGERPNRLSQRVTGLVPGDSYVLQFVTFDADDAAAHRYAPRRIAIRADFGGGAEVRRDLSWTHVDRRRKSRYDKNGAKVNLNRIVFVARSPELDLVFTDDEAKPGERLGLNWIYFAKHLN